MSLIDVTQMLIGTLLTMKLFIVTLVFSIPLGLIMTFLYTGKNKTLSRITGFYILIMRGTPLLLQMFFIYFGLPVLPIIGKYLVLGRFQACAVAFFLNYAAYFAEIFRGGLLAVDSGQYEAAKVLGMSPMATAIRVVLPQMFRVSLPAISNETIILVKDTALVYALAQPDLLQVTYNIVNRTASITPFAIAAAFYLIMSYILTMLFRNIEKKFVY